jgi:putative ABC transport system permease protein
MQSPAQPTEQSPVTAGARFAHLALAAADLWHDRRTSAILVLTVASIIAPLLLLFGLKTGVISTLRTQLLNDPHTLEIIVVGAQDLRADWLAALAARADAAFVLPRTRSINATMDLVDSRRITYEVSDMIPTAPGDPLLTRGLPEGVEPPPLLADGTEILLTETLADEIGIGAGGTLTGVIRRSRQGLPENAQIQLGVAAIIPEQVVSKKAVFTHQDLLIASEDYRDGLRDTLTAEELAVPIHGNRERFANARVYATDLDGVGTLAAFMRKAGVEVNTQAEQIAFVKGLDRVLGFIFRVIAIIGIGGCALALGGALWVNVDRKRRDLALLRLFGYGNGSVVLLPLAQSAAIAALGFVLALLAYGGGALAFNAVLGANLAERGYVCRLEAIYIALAAAATLLFALLAAITAGYRASRIDPAECLRGG